LNFQGPELGTRIASVHIVEVRLQSKGERMQSEIVAMLIPEGSPGAALLVRRGDGQFLLERIDTRVAAAARVASRWSRKGSARAAPSGAAHMVDMV
jgi:hypothetical protein